MKKLATLLAAAALMLSLAACGNNAGTPSSPEPDANEPETVGNEYITIDGICVDDSYQDDEGSPLKLVYVFYTLNATGENLQIDSNYMDLTAESGNAYESEYYPDDASACDFTPNYYYSSYIEDVYTGTSIKVAATFKVPEADLEAGKTITLSDSQIPAEEPLEVSTDIIQHFAGGDEIAQAMDPEGYAAEMDLRTDADEETAAQVKSLINGYYWQFYVNNMYYEVEFWADNNFQVRTSIATSNGTYTVKKGYIFCTYPDTGYTVEVPYTLTDGNIELDLTDAFDVKG